MLHGCISALVTPLLADGSIDYPAVAGLVEWQIESGVAGLVVVGSTGEAAALTVTERIAMIQTVVAVNQGRVKIIVGSGTTSTAQTLEFIQQLNGLSGIDYLMCVTPYFVKPTQQGLYQHFASIAATSRFPLILYNVPSRTGCDLNDDTSLRLAADFSNIVGLKDATGDIRRCVYLVTHRPQGFSLFSGDDGSALAFLFCGGDGVISVVSNLRPRLFSSMVAAALAGRRELAITLNRHLMPLYDLLFCEANPIPLKWGLFHEQRINSAGLRLPLTVLDSAYHEQLVASLSHISEPVIAPAFILKPALQSVI